MKYTVFLLAVVIIFSGVLFSLWQGGGTLSSLVVENIRDCLTRYSTDPCYETLAKDLLARFTLSDSLEALAIVTPEKPEYLVGCHALTHYLGQEAFYKEQSVAKVFAQCDELCDGGCYHGTLEGYVKDRQLSVRDSATLEAHVRTVCGNRENHPVLRLYEKCLHGLGHALMFATQGKIPEALRLCDVAPGSTEERENCYGGVFMEYNMNTRPGAAHASVSSDPLYPCTVVQEQHQSLCYFLSAQRFLILGRSWANAVALCEKAPKAYQGQCMRELGMETVIFKENQEGSHEVCNLASSEELATFCRHGVAFELVDRYFNDPADAIGRAHAFCAMLPSVQHTECYREVAYAVRKWSRDSEEFRRYCSLIPVKEYADQCTNLFNQYNEKNF